MTMEKCINVTHQARNGAQALMGQMIALRIQLDNLGILDQVDLNGIDAQIQRIVDAVDQCRPPYPVSPHDINKL